MTGQKIPISLLMTPQEHVFAGSTPPVIPKKGSSSWYIPVGVEQRNFGIDEIALARREIGFMNTPVIGMALGVRRGAHDVVGFVFSDLTSDGHTTIDPDLRVGRWDQEAREIVGKSLTIQFQTFQREYGGEDLRLRIEGRHPEHRRGGKETK